MMSASSSGANPFGGGAAGGGIDLYLGLARLGVSLFALTLFGTPCAGLIYALQLWVQRSPSFGEALQHSVELLRYRLRQHLMAWSLAALLAGAAALNIAATASIALPPLAAQLGVGALAGPVAGACAWLIGSIAGLPPLFIWMALLYRRDTAAFDGADLSARIAEWQQLNAAPISPPTTCARKTSSVQS
jgi:hypothetical protein